MQNVPASSLTDTSRIVVGDLRRAEQSINVATRDTAQFLVTALDAATAQGLSAAMAHGTVKATVCALSALVESQGQMAMRAHIAIEKVGHDLGLTETSWGESAPKPRIGRTAGLTDTSVGEGALKARVGETTSPLHEHVA